MNTGQHVTFSQGDAGNTELAGVISRVWPNGTMVTIKAPAPSPGPSAPSFASSAKSRQPDVDPEIPRPSVFTRWDAEDAEVQAKLAELDNPLAGLVQAFDAEAARMRATMGDQQGTAYAKHTAYFFAELFGPASDGPQKFGPGYVTDVCRCGHERGSHGTATARVTRRRAAAAFSASSRHERDGRPWRHD